MDNETKTLLHKIYKKVILMEQGLNGVEGGPDGLYSKVKTIENRQNKLEKYTNMFHGILLMSGICISAVVTIYQVFMK